MTDISKELSRAKILMLGKQNSVFLSTVCLSLETIVDDTIPTACTNGKYIKFNPEFFLQLTEEERVFVLAHETLHVVFMHMSRRGSRDPMLWNVAGDFVINLLLKEQGFKLCDGVLYDAQYDGMSTEEVYDSLIQEGKDKQFSPDFEDIEEMEFDSPAEQEAFAEKIKDVVVRAKIMAEMSGAGQFGGSVERFLSDILRPKLNWKTLLKRYVTATMSREDYSWRRPKQKGGLYFPRLYSPKVGQIDIAIDTSGSISNDQFNQFMSEVFSILKSVKPSSIGLIQWDHELRSNTQLTTVKDFLRLPFLGGGGTLVSKAFEGFAQNKTSQMMVVITDGYFANEDTVKEMRPILWIVHNNPTFIPPWGRKDKVIHYTV